MASRLQRRQDTAEPPGEACDGSPIRGGAKSSPTRAPAETGVATEEAAMMTSSAPDAGQSVGPSSSAKSSVTSGSDARPPEPSPPASGSPSPTPPVLVVVPEPSSSFVKDDSPSSMASEQPSTTAVTITGTTTATLTPSLRESVSSQSTYQTPKLQDQSRPPSPELPSLAASSPTETSKVIDADTTTSSTSTTPSQPAGGGGSSASRGDNGAPSSTAATNPGENPKEPALAGPVESQIEAPAAAAPSSSVAAANPGENQNDPTAAAPSSPAAAVPALIPNENAAAPPASSAPVDAAASQDAPAPLPSEILNPAQTNSNALSLAPSTLMTDPTTSPAAPSPVLATPVSNSLDVTLSNPSPAASSASDTTDLGPIASPTGTGRGVTSNNGGSSSDGGGGGGGSLGLPDSSGSRLASDSSSHTGMIVGGVVGGATALAVIMLLLWLWRRKAQKNKEQPGQPRTPMSAIAPRDNGGDSNNNDELMAAIAAAPGVVAATNTATTAGQQQQQQQQFAAGRQASTMRGEKSALQNWWAAYRISNAPAAALTTLEYGDRQEAVVPLQQPVPARTRRGSAEQRAAAAQDPFSDSHSMDASGGIPPQQQSLRGILKHNRSPSDGASILGAAAAARRMRTSSSNPQKQHQRASSTPKAISIYNNGNNNNNIAPSRVPTRTFSLAGDGAMDSFEDRRTKFRSDPFDLELDPRMLSTTTATGTATAAAAARRTQWRDTQASSVYSSLTAASGSMYTSVSVPNWSEVGGTLPATGLRFAPLAVSSGVGVAAGGGAVLDSPTLPLEKNARRFSNSTVGQAF